jgi:hypothetical protein
MTEKYFYKWDRSSDGFNSQCAECSRKYVNEKHAINPEANRQGFLNWYYKDEINKRKKLDKNRKYIQDNIEERRKYLKSYQEENAEQVNQYSKNRRHKEHRITKEEWENCKKYFNYTCAYCGKPLKEHYVMRKGKLILMDFHKEHVIHSGRIDLKNCIPSCQSCNDRKWKFTLNEWYNSNNPVYTFERYHKIYLWLRYDYKDYIKKRKPKQKYNKKNQ